MREIKFKGKRIDNDEWIYGDLVLSYGRAWIKNRADKTTNPLCMNTGKKTADFNMVETNSETIGQYTGLKDKNGKEIYEGDILDRKGKKCIVVFHESEFSLKVDDNQYIQHGLLVDIWKDYIEVIGNIHDNPELIKGKER